MIAIKDELKSVEELANAAIRRSQRGVFGYIACDESRT